MNLKKWTTSILILFFLSSWHLSAQEVFSVNYTKEQVLIGEQIVVQAQINNIQSNHNYTISIGEDKTQKIEIIKKFKPQKINNYLIQKFIITSFDSGAWQIPPIVAQDKTDNREWTAEIKVLKFTTFPVDTAQPFKPIKDIRLVEKPETDWRTRWLIFLGLVFLSILIWYLVKKKLRKKAPVKILTPYEEAKEALRKIEEQRVWENESDIKNYYVDLTNIMRLYVHKEYGLNAMEITSEELLQGIKKYKKISKHSDIISKVLTRADLAKFAKTQPGISENKESFDLIKLLIESIRNIPKEEEKTSNGI